MKRNNKVWEKKVTEVMSQVRPKRFHHLVILVQTWSRALGRPSGAGPAKAEAGD